MKGKLIKKENHYYFWSSDWNPEKNEGFVANSEGTIERKLSIKNCEAIENGYDLDELASQRYIIKNTGDMFMPNPHEVSNIFRQEGFKAGFQKALEILGDKKFSEEDIKKMMKSASYGWLESDFDKHLATLQQTEWDVEIITEDTGLGARISRKRKLDSNGCLILKRI